MIHDHPVLALLHECEAIARRQRLGLPVLDARECVVAGVDSGAAIDADQLLAERDLQTRQDLERRDEEIAQRGSTCSHGRREPPPKTSTGGIERNNIASVVLSTGMN